MDTSADVSGRRSRIAAIADGILFVLGTVILACWAAIVFSSDWDTGSRGGRAALVIVAGAFYGWYAYRALRRLVMLSRSR